MNDELGIPAGVRYIGIILKFCFRWKIHWIDKYCREELNLVLRLNIDCVKSELNFLEIFILFVCFFEIFQEFRFCVGHFSHYFIFFLEQFVFKNNSHTNPYNLYSAYHRFLLFKYLFIV